MRGYDPIGFDYSHSMIPRPGEDTNPDSSGYKVPHWICPEINPEGTLYTENMHALKIIKPPGGQAGHWTVCTWGDPLVVGLVIVFGFPRASSHGRPRRVLMVDYPSSPTGGFVPGEASSLGMPWCEAGRTNHARRAV